jgi:hypothetical protein
VGVVVSMVADTERLMMEKRFKLDQIHLSIPLAYTEHLVVSMVFNISYQGAEAFQERHRTV